MEAVALPDRIATDAPGVVHGVLSAGDPSGLLAQFGDFRGFISCEHFDQRGRFLFDLLGNLTNEKEALGGFLFHRLDAIEQSVGQFQRFSDRLPDRRILRPRNRLDGKVFHHVGGEEKEASENNETCSRCR